MRKISKLLVFVILMFIGCCNVFAESIKIEEVASEFKNAYIIKLMEKIGYGFEIELDTNNNILRVITTDEEEVSFNYNDEYIEYDNKDFSVTEENYEEAFIPGIIVEGLLETLFNLSGHVDKRLDDYNVDVTYEVNGLQLDSEHYSYSGSDEDGSWEVSGENVKYLKVSLDSAKIAKIAEKYGINISDDDEDIASPFIDIVPTVKVDDITSSSMTIYANIDGYNFENSEDVPYCSIYRSDKIDGEFEKISDWDVACDGVGITDENLQSGITYYYKAKVVGGSEYSEVVSATTLGESTVNNTNNGNKEEVITNPKTGSTFIYITILFLLVSVVSFIKLFNYVKEQNEI